MLQDGERSNQGIDETRDRVFESWKSIDPTGIMDQFDKWKNKFAGIKAEIENPLDFGKI